MPSKTGGISEADLLLPTLIELANSPADWLSMRQLIEKLAVAVTPSEDAAIVEGRTDAQLSELVRDMVGNKAVPGNIIHEGYVEHVDDGLKITDSGHKYLQRKGY